MTTVQFVAGRTVKCLKCSKESLVEEWGIAAIIGQSTQVLCPHCEEWMGATHVRVSSEGPLMKKPHDFQDREDGLDHCKVCGGAEGDLTSDCPGYLVSEETQREIYMGRVDFIDMQWVHKSSKRSQQNTPNTSSVKGQS